MRSVRAGRVPDELAFDLDDELDAAHVTGGLYVGTFEDGMRWIIEEGAGWRLGGFLGDVFSEMVLASWATVWQRDAPAA